MRRSAWSARKGRDAQAAALRDRNVALAMARPDLDEHAAHMEAVLAGTEAGYRWLDRELAALCASAASQGISTMHPSILSVSARHTLAYQHLAILRDCVDVLRAALARKGAAA